MDYFLPFNGMFFSINFVSWNRVLERILKEWKRVMDMNRVRKMR